MEENKIYQNDNPKNGPLDGVQLRTDCVRTKFTQKRQKTGYPFKQSQTKANVSASVETGTFSIRDVQTNSRYSLSTRLWHCIRKRLTIPQVRRRREDTENCTQCILMTRHMM